MHPPADIDVAFAAFAAAQGDAWNQAPPHIQDLVRSSWIAGAWALLYAVAGSLDPETVAAIGRDIEHHIARHPRRTLQ